MSDDNSDDGRTNEILEVLKSSDLDFTFARKANNTRYDSNLRSAISLSCGKYCVLMGNDDCLADERSLGTIYEELSHHERVGVYIPNFADYRTGKVTRRVLQTRLYSGEPRVAAWHFRNLAFVSGVALLRGPAQEHSTAKWDGSEMYQMFLGCRIVAEGYNLLESTSVPVRKDVQIPGETVASYARRPRVQPCPIVERRLPLTDLGRVVYSAIEPHLRPEDTRVPFEVFAQILIFTYGFWILEYRRVQSWRFAAGMCLGLRPRNTLAGVHLRPVWAIAIRGLYGMVVLGGLTLPIRLFDKMRGGLYRAAKTLTRRS
jgi:hypothetical protein